VRHVGQGNEQEPLSETVFLILSSLAAEPRHGYAILQDVESLTGGRVRLSTGTLYGALRRLLEEGLIRRFREAQPSRDRQAYELTAGGRQALAAEVDRMRRLSGIAAKRLIEREA
jgi:DNA-binding PadR family transcriptional regulator